MRFIIFVLFAFISFTANARVLHVGDNVIKLSQAKTTSPALHVRVGDELWYANMGRCQLPMNENTDKELKIKYNNTDYWVSEIEPTKDYVIADGKLIAANCNIYLESTGTQWIDPIIKTSDDIAYETLISFTRTDREQIIGVGGALNMSISTRIVLGFDDFVWHQVNCCHYNKTHFGIVDTNRHLIINDAYNKFFKLDSEKVSTPERTELKDFYSFYIGTYSRQGYPDLNFSWYTKIHSFKFYKSNTLVRHFVPVPCGLQIGEFVVPSNGMWDIVEQKFYGNMGTGDFIYGVDD